MRILTIMLFALLTLVTAPASAAPVPDSAVHLRIIARDDVGFIVEVTNPSNDVAPFDGIGLYLVPESSGAEQRLGVVAAGQVMTADGTWTDAPGVISVAPYGSIRVKLTAYCLDEHRVAPNSKTQYHLANHRMPTELTTALEGAARTVASLGYDPEGAVAHAVPANLVASYTHGATQQALWRVRAAMPVALIGDGVTPARVSSTQSLPVTNGYWRR